MHRTDADQHVNVIGCTVDDKRCAVHLADDAAKVGEKIGADFGRYERLAIFGAKDEVKDEIARGVRQVSFAPSELAHYFATVPRLAPWAAFLRRFAAKGRIRRASGEGTSGSGNVVPRVSFRNERSRPPTLSQRAQRSWHPLSGCRNAGSADYLFIVSSGKNANTEIRPHGPEEVARAGLLPPQIQISRGAPRRGTRNK